jgi:hypothetical protein
MEAYPKTISRSDASRGFRWFSDRHLVKSSFRRQGTSRGKLFGLVLAKMREHPGNKERSLNVTADAILYFD